jgi:hypothetical protein
MFQRLPDDADDAVSTRSVPERSDLVLAFARVLHVNGQSTHETLAAAARLGKSCGLDATIIPHWRELQIQTMEGGSPRIAMVAAGPTGAQLPDDERPDQ